MSDTSSLPDSRIVITVDTKNQGVDAGVKELNPILQEIMKSVKTSAQAARPGLTASKFGRLQFAEHMY